MNSEIDLDVKPRIPRPAHAARGDVSRNILKFIREATEPVSLAQITEHVMTERNLDIADKRLVARQSRAIEKRLRVYRDKGFLASKGRAGHPLYWKIATPE